MAHSVKPLVEKPIHRLAGGFFDRNPKLFGINRLIGVFGQVMIDSAPPIFLAEISAQHVQDRAATWIRICVKYRVGISIVLGYDWTAISLAPRVVILILITFNIKIEKI